MSNIVSAAVYPLQMPPTAKAVLVSMADNANDFGECFPSISTICMRTCFGKTAVIEAIKWLETQGMIVADRGPRGSGTRYTILAGRVNDLFVRPSGPGDGPVRRRNVRQLYPNRSASRTTFDGETHQNDANLFGSRTGPADGLVRETDDPSPSAGHDWSASRTEVVRQADPNHKEPSVTLIEPSSAQARDDDEEQLSDPEIMRVLAPLSGAVEFVSRTGLSANTLARFIRHRRVINRPVSISAWFEIRGRLQQLADQGHDLNRSLRQTIAAGLALPVTPTYEGESNHADNRSSRSGGLGGRVAANAERAVRTAAGSATAEGSALRVAGGHALDPDD